MEFFVGLGLVIFLLLLFFMSHDLSDELSRIAKGNEKNTIIRKKIEERSIFTDSTDIFTDPKYNSLPCNAFYDESRKK